MIHDAGESYFSSEFLNLQGTSTGLTEDEFLYPGMSFIGNTPVDPQDPFAFDQLYSTGDYAMNNMPRTNLPSSGNARNQGGAGTGAGIIKRESRPTRQAAGATSQAGSRTARGAAPNPGQPSNQFQGYDIDLTGMDYPTGSPSTMGLYGSNLNSSMDPSSFAAGSYNPLSGSGGGIQQNPQPQGYRNISPVPKFENPDLPSTPNFISPSQYESFAEEEPETKPDLHRLRNEGTPTPAHRRRPSLAYTDTSPATANTTSSPANDPFVSPGQGGGGGEGGSSSGRQTAQNTPNHPAHVPPNRIQEAGPIMHPDPEWRPYGINHWHVFLTEPTTLKYMSSTEIKDIRDHCYGLAQAAGDEDADEGEPIPIAEGSRYTTADAQAVWRHCDAYVRRRSQVRNNQAARRSRQRKDAETRYWKAKALEYGAPDHEFNWDLVEESPPGTGTGTGQQGGGSSSTAAAENAGQAARARNRAQQGGQAQAQGQARQQGQGQGHGQAGRGSSRQGQAAAARRASAPSGPKPEFDFNQPLDYDEDDKSHGGGFDAFTGGF